MKNSKADKLKKLSPRFWLISIWNKSSEQSTWRVSCFICFQLNIINKKFRMTNFFVKLLLIASLVAGVFCQQEVNLIVWRAMCTRTLPAEPQTDNFPLVIDIFPDPIFNSYGPGEQVLVTLQVPAGSDFTFTGFLIFARTTASRTPVGRWAAGANGREISCSDNENFIGDDAAAQGNVDERQIQTLVWTAPSEPGNYIFELTTIEQFTSYWEDQFSPVLRVV